MSREAIDFEALEALVAGGLDLPEPIQRIKSRCDECGDCWIWPGHVDANGIPKINVDGTPRSVRRVLYEHFHGPVRPKMEVKAKCGLKRCVSPNCSDVFTRSASMKLAARDRVTSAAHINAARKRGKLDAIKAAEIRESTLTLVQLAAQYGVDKKVIWNVKHGKAWKAPSPFAGLGKR